MLIARLFWRKVDKNELERRDTKFYYKGNGRLSFSKICEKFIATIQALEN